METVRPDRLITGTAIRLGGRRTNRIRCRDKSRWFPGDLRGQAGRLALAGFTPGYTAEPSPFPIAGRTSHGGGCLALVIKTLVPSSWIHATPCNGLKSNVVTSTVQAGAFRSDGLLRRRWMVLRDRGENRWTDSNPNLRQRRGLFSQRADPGMFTRKNRSPLDESPHSWPRDDFPDQKRGAVVTPVVLVGHLPVRVIKGVFKGRFNGRFQTLEGGHQDPGRTPGRRVARRG